MRHFRTVQFKRKLVAILLLSLAAFTGEAAHTRARLLTAATEVRPGDTMRVGILLNMDSGWHTYWKNPGASGMATKVDWVLPPGITISELEWPVPEKLIEEELTTYIYKGQALLLATLKFAPGIKLGPQRLQAKVSWLECLVQCVPGSTTVEATVQVGNQNRPGEDGKPLEDGMKALPKAGAAIAATAAWEKTATGDTRPLILQWPATGTAGPGDFYPSASEDFEVLGPSEQLPAMTADKASIRIRKQVKKSAGDWPQEISGLLVEGSGDKVTSYEVRLKIGGQGAPPPAAQTISAPGSPPSVVKMLIYAFIGGLILNVMPCVLPVIALKILGFVGQAKEDRAQARKLGLVYALGVILSFLMLALLTIGLKSAGHRAGWGFQFGNPYFLLAMTTLVTLIALNLFGVFEVILGGRAMDKAAALSSKHGVAGAFFNGLLATVLATSCTAPFLGAAVGFASAQSAPLLLLILTTVGLGLAAPYVVLTWQPAWLRFLPKPGPWMERFKVAMGFPMLAAAVWLFSLVSVHYGDRTWWLAIFLVMVAVGAWVFGEFIQRHRTRPGLAIVVICGVLVAAYVWVLDGQLQWRQPSLVTASSTGPSHIGNGVAWQTWSPAAVSAARAERRAILVDFTAKWCLTCNTIVKPALESATVRKKLQELNVLPLLGDYTAFPENIAEELNRHGRDGVPLVLVYPRDPAQPPIVLPEALTPGMVVDALGRATR
jgi:thiol:disulfide interchange protein